MFVSYYTTIYFFIKKLIFFNVYVLVNTVFECRYMFFGWDRGSQLSTYATGRGRTVIQNACTEHMEKVPHASCVRTHLLYLFSCFGSIFVL